MMCNAVLCFALVLRLSHAALLPYTTQFIQRDQEISLPAEYNYEYSVADALTGDYHSAQEARRGDSTNGQYSLIQPDGQRRTVTYNVNGDSGFVAHVQYDSSGQPPSGSPSRPPSSYGPPSSAPTPSQPPSSEYLPPPIPSPPQGLPPTFPSPPQGLPPSSPSPPQGLPPSFPSPPQGSAPSRPTPPSLYLPSRPSLAFPLQPALAFPRPLSSISHTSFRSPFIMYAY